MSQTLTPQKVDKLFKKFSRPLVKAAITKHQKEVSLGIAKILWLSLVKGKDTEPNIYNILSQVLNNNHESNIAMGSLYFFKMKTALSETDIQALINYYSIDQNFKDLENWLDELHY